MIETKTHPTRRKKVNIRTSDDEIWFWYCHHEKRIVSSMSITEYARKHKIDEQKFIIMSSRISYCEHSDPGRYNRIIELAQKYINCTLPLKTFWKENASEFPEYIIGHAATHIKYKQIIERLKKSRIC